jgi:hypothetical protein
MTLTHFDLNDPTVIADPYSHYAWLHAPERRPGLPARYCVGSGHCRSS